MKNILIKTILMFIFAVTVLTLYSFRPENRHFINDYQYQLFKSWVERGNFRIEGKANITHNSIALVFQNRELEKETVVKFALDGGNIVHQSEVIELIDFKIDKSRLSYLPYIEQLLFRVNSNYDFFITDYITRLNIDLCLVNNCNADSVANYLINNHTDQRLTITSLNFEEEQDNKLSCQIVFNDHLTLQVLFNDTDNLDDLALSLRGQEFHSDNLRKISQTLPDVVYPAYTQNAYLYPIPQTFDDLLDTDIIPKHIDSIKMSNFFSNYKDYSWSREMLHNKIQDPKLFLQDQFPNHTIDYEKNNIELKTESFKNIFNGNLKLIYQKLRDGIVFNSCNQYHLEQNNNVTLTTGETVSFENLNSYEIDNVVPFMNQLVIMHRAIGTKLLNFLLIPADVPTTFVLRDPDRQVIYFDSYTDLLLMLSHYWQGHNIYFNIDNVKIINDYVEIEASLIANKNNQDNFDFAEIKFALNSHFRIDLAMIVVHTNVTSKLEEERVP